MNIKGTHIFCIWLKTLSDFPPPRYIDQYHTLLTSSSSSAQREDLDMYRIHVLKTDGHYDRIENSIVIDPTYAAYVVGQPSNVSETTVHSYYAKWLNTEAI